MNMLIYGAGVIGTTYGWQLSEAGHRITLLVRPEIKKSAETNGIKIHCLDYRSEKKQEKKVTFRPHIIETLTEDHPFEYILATTNCLFIKEILPLLKKGAGKTPVVFMQNIWNDFEEIAQYLRPEQYFFGFPFMCGGGKNDEEIHCTISGFKTSHTPLGEVNG